MKKKENLNHDDDRFDIDLCFVNVSKNVVDKE